MYNLPTENKYNNYSFREIIDIIKSNLDPNDIELATELTFLIKQSAILFSFEENMKWNTGRSYFTDTIFSKFSNNIRNNIFKAFHNLPLKTYVSLRALEILDKYFDVKYNIDGFHYSAWGHYISLSTNKTPLQISIEELAIFFNSITNEKYKILLEQYLPIFVNEYNKTHKTNEIFICKDIDMVCTYIDLKNINQIVKYTYKTPSFYQYLLDKNRVDIDFAKTFLDIFRCNSVSLKLNEKQIKIITKNLIENNFYEDSDMFYKFLRGQKTSHFCIYFSKHLKKQLRADLILSIECYANCCSKYKKDVAKMLGRKITDTHQFKYIFGTKK